MSKEIYYQRKIETILSKTKEYYENDKERLREQSKIYYKELSERETMKKLHTKDINREYGINRYKNMSEENKEILKEYQKNYCKTRKS